MRANWEEGEHLDKNSGFIDVRKSASVKELFLSFWCTTPFWQSIKQVSKNLWNLNNPEEIWRRIAITNMVKCSNSDYGDETTPLMKTNCIKRAKFFENEIEVIDPTHIIFFTGPNYDDYVTKLFGFNKTSLKTFKRADNEIWLSGKFTNKNRIKITFLRTYHPGYYKNIQKKEDFCKEIVSWIRTFS